MIFYSRYKRFRLDNKISLEDIQRRTKIDVDSIKAMESGKFSEISPVYVRLFFKAYLKEIGVDLDEGMSELDDFLNQKSSNSKPEHRKEKKIDKKIEKDNNPKFVDIINTKKAINPNILIGLVGFLILILLSFLLNNSSDISNIDKENELRISQSLLDNLYVVRTEEVLSEENFVFPITIRFKSINENYIKYSDEISAKEYFVFDEGNNNQSSSFSEIWNGDNRSFLIANTVNFELVFFSEDTFRDFSDSIVNDFPVRVDLISDPLSVSITKYIPKR